MQFIAVLKIQMIHMQFTARTVFSWQSRVTFVSFICKICHNPYLPSNKEAEPGGEGAAGGPAEEAEEGRERTGAAVEEEGVLPLQVQEAAAAARLRHGSTDPWVA